MASAGGAPRTSAERAAFAQKLKDTVETLMDSYARILEAAKVGTRTNGRETAERERLQLTTHAAGVVAEVQALFKMITELKLSVLTSNLEGLNVIVDERNAAFNAERTGAEAKLKRLRADVDATLGDLETHFYSSVYR